MLWAGDADSSRPSMCLTAETNTDGAPVALSECGSAGKATFPDGNQNWVWARDPLTGLVKTFDGTKCLDIPNGDTTNGNRLQIWSCDASNPNQQFRIQNPWPWAVKWAGGNKCLETPNGNFTAGTLIEISDCDSSKVSQHWF
ncbi:hypothetical protein PQX77_006079 [Marasmius sp. AFHP31]|nr:hypothetical protein PQX77_006079 [Marasmius sp. AFHP31]